MELIFKTVYHHPLLSSLELETIAAAHTLVETTKNTVVLKEGEVANAYYILEKGLMRTYVHDYNNDETTTGFFSAGELVIAPTSLFQRMPSQEIILTVTDCVLWKIEFETFQKLFHTMPGFVEWGRLWFTSQLFAIKQRSLDMVRVTATNRYLNLIKEKPEIIKHVPLKQIASYLGITDTSLSRIRKEITE